MLPKSPPADAITSHELGIAVIDCAFDPTDSWEILPSKRRTGCLTRACRSGLENL
jgi:hypothetical protein